MTSHMPNRPGAAGQPEPSLARGLLQVVRYHLLSRTGLLSIAGVAVVIGAALNWSWLVATGIAPLVISVLPCAIMCAFGLCAHRLVGGSCATDQSRATAKAGRAEASKAQLDLFEQKPAAPAQIDERNEAHHGGSADSRPADERRHIHA